MEPLSFLDILTLVITTVSILLTLCTIIAHFLLKEMLHHPGHLVFLQCIFQLIVDFHWYTSITSVSHYYAAHKSECMIIGVLAIGSSLMFFSYLLALTIEIVIKLKNATTVSYSKRNIFYHVFAISITISFCLLGILRNEFGESKMHTCSLIDNRVTRTVYSSYVMASIFAIWGLLIYIWKKIKESSSGIVFSYSLVVMSVTTTITISTLMDILKSYTNGESKQYNAVGVIFGSLTGTCIALARLSNRNLLKKLKVRLFVSRARQLTDTMLSLLNPEESISVEATFFGEFFDSITKKILFQILVMMHIRFHSEDSETSEKVYIDYHFTDKEIKKTIQKSFGKSRHHNSILYAVCLSGKFIREYMGFEFSQIRKMCEVTSSQLQRQVLCRSMALYMNNSNISRIEGGSSHAFIFTTYDDMFVIKTITSAERKLFIKMLPKYLSRIMCHENSRLVRILGIFKLLPDNQDFLIMENIVPDKKKAMIFDLKGSLVDRKVEGTEDFPKGVVLKDQNFIDCKMKIRLGEEQMKEILSTLEEDFELLESENIMDYSILLAVYDRNLRNDNRYCFNSLGKSYSLGIIDILQEYNFVKISEKNIKSIYKKNRVMMSVAEPNKYFNRITGFLLNIFEVIDEE